ncbi:hypothetical protein [Paludibaculum fermentans]|uniref:hypothetical protein n=1 Tax=Paludibaculum fermentans TaxID=1473598 RepID=UPI003EB7BC1F
MWCRLVLGALLCFPASGGLLVYQTTVDACYGEFCSSYNVATLPDFPDGLGKLESYYLGWDLKGFASVGISIWEPEPGYGCFGWLSYTASASGSFTPSELPGIHLDYGHGEQMSHECGELIEVGLNASSKGGIGRIGSVSGISLEFTFYYGEESHFSPGFHDPVFVGVTGTLSVAYKYADLDAIPEPGTGLLTGGPLILAALALARRRWSPRHHRFEMTD